SDERVDHDRTLGGQIGELDRLPVGTVEREVGRLLAHREGGGRAGPAEREDEPGDQHQSLAHESLHGREVHFSGKALTASSTNDVSTIPLRATVRFMKPLSVHHFICRSISVTSRRAFRSWKGKPSRMISGLA